MFGFNALQLRTAVHIWPFCHDIEFETLRIEVYFCSLIAHLSFAPKFMFGHFWSCTEVHVWLFLIIFIFFFFIYFMVPMLLYLCKVRVSVCSYVRMYVPTYVCMYVRMEFSKLHTIAFQTLRLPTKGGVLLPLPRAAG